MPRWAEMILDGRKTVEIRRRSPGVRRGDVLALYASGTRRAVVGSALVRRVERVAAELVWGHLRGRGGIDRPALEDYLRGCERACLIELEAPRAGAAEVLLSQLRRAAPGFNPPQSARRLRPGLAADRAVLDLLGLWPR
ncbi:MAG: hypothetical protein C0475_06645 [Planctomyces sp.]|nr:hypothetical protein [Planctomyces sp.]